MHVSGVLEEAGELGENKHSDVRTQENKQTPHRRSRLRIEPMTSSWGDFTSNHVGDSSASF